MLGARQLNKETRGKISRYKICNLIKTTIQKMISEEVILEHQAKLAQSKSEKTGTPDHECEQSNV